jgi:hypothetical protein
MKTRAGGEAARADQGMHRKLRMRRRGIKAMRGMKEPL